MVGVAGVEPDPVIPTDETVDAKKKAVEEFRLEDGVVTKLVDAVGVERTDRAMQEKQERREQPVLGKGTPNGSGPAQQNTARKPTVCSSPLTSLRAFNARRISRCTGVRYQSIVACSS